MVRVVALIAPGPDPTRELLAVRVAEIADDIALAVGDVGIVRHAIETTSGPESTASSLSMETSEFAAVIEIVVPDDNDMYPAIESLSGLSQRLGDMVDAAESVVVVGPDHLVVPGMGDLQIHVALRRKDGIDHDEYLRIWEEEFAPLAATTPYLAGYRQIPNLFAPSAAAASAAGFGVSDVDGIALEWFPSAALLQEAAVWSEETIEHVETRQRFLNEGQARSLLSDNPMDSSVA